MLLFNYILFLYNMESSKQQVYTLFVIDGVIPEIVVYTKEGKDGLRIPSSKV